MSTARRSVLASRRSSRSTALRCTQAGSFTAAAAPLTVIRPERTALCSSGIAGLSRPKTLAAVVTELLLTQDEAAPPGTIPRP